MKHDPQRPRADVELHIDSLVLEGVPQAHHHRVAASLQAELAQLVERDGLEPGAMSGRQLDTVNGGHLPASARETPERLGAALARAIHRELSR
ncbi:MAG: hypothetical protein H6739_36600 [Alphaproteobacteria bacterium]|nr:hypothetical protein [Alphaproteobacteria bacterium]